MPDTLDTALDWGDLPGNGIKCVECETVTAWYVRREASYDFDGTPYEGADAIICCSECGLVARSDGKIADPEGRLSG